MVGSLTRIRDLPNCAVPEDHPWNKPLEATVSHVDWTRPAFGTFVCFVFSTRTRLSI